MAAINKDIVLVVSLVLSVVSLVLLFGVTWYFQSSLDLLQQQVEYDRELLFKLQEQINVSKHIIYICSYIATLDYNEFELHKDQWTGNYVTSKQQATTHVPIKINIMYTMAMWLFKHTGWPNMQYIIISYYGNNEHALHHNQR